MDEDVKERAAAVAAARDESVEQVLARFGEDGIGRAPRSFSKHIATLRGLSFDGMGVTDGLAWISLPDGLTLWGYIAEPHHQRAFEYVRDLLPEGVTAETFLVALDASHRVASDFAWPPSDIRIRRDGWVVECGAYLGHKSMRFARELVPDGQVTAIEMLPDNVAVAARNFRSNGLADAIELVECGVWDQPGKIQIKGKGRQRNTIADLPKLDEEVGVLATVRRLDEILADGPDPIVDLLFLTVNGAEVEALNGLGELASRVGCVFVAAPYSTHGGGRSNADICRDLVREQGFRLHPASRGSRIIGVRERPGT